ncbi:MAG: hypothetical protein FWG02_00960 [Holophagaceae bacterium]|nr:hypothetical protein [Holophagaceae bacterium]
MKNATTQLTAILVAILMGIFSLACLGNDNPKAMVGNWIHEDGRQTMELFADGTGITDGMAITWKVVNKRFIFGSPKDNFACNYNISGGKLVSERASDFETRLLKESV